MKRTHGPGQEADNYCLAGRCMKPTVDGLPAPLCEHHSQRVFAHVLASMDLGEAILTAIADVKAEADAVTRTTLQELQTLQAVQSLGKGGGIVYFMQSPDDELIKIGWTSDLRQRLRWYSACSLLHAEAGKRSHEKALHAEFQDLNHLPMGRYADKAGRTEWFLPEPRLLARIEQLASAGDSLSRTQGVKHSETLTNYSGLWTTKEIRAWARASGYMTVSKGRIEPHILQAYEKAVLAA